MSESKRIKLLKYFGEVDVIKTVKFRAVAILLFILHFILMLANEDINFIGSYGALLTVFGLLASFTHSLYPQFNDELKPPYQPFGGEMQLIYQKQSSFVLDRNLRELPIDNFEADNINELYNTMILNKYKSLITTYYLTIVGTLIWAYVGYFKSFLTCFLFHLSL